MDSFWIMFKRIRVSIRRQGKGRLGRNRYYSRLMVSKHRLSPRMEAYIISFAITVYVYEVPKPIESCIGV